MLLPLFLKLDFYKKFPEVRKDTIRQIILKLGDLNSEGKEICKIMLWKLVTEEEVLLYR